MIVYVNGYYYYKVNVMTNNVMIEDLIKYFKETLRANFERLGREGRLKMKKQVINKRICMEAIYLQSMTDFVLEIKVKSNKSSDFSFMMDYSKIFNYVKFLKKPLQLGFFVPCDENGNVLEEPKRWNDYLQFPDSFDGNKEWGELYNYELAIERLLFKGFYIENFKSRSYKFSKITSDKVTVAFWNEISLWAMENKFKNIESLASYKLELTQTAIKQIGL